MLHHKANQFDTQQKVFEQLTVASATLDNPETALQEIDRVLAAIARHKRPGYLELPRDMVSAKGTPVRAEVQKGKVEPAALAEALNEAVGKISAAAQPVLLVGDEIQRLGLEEQVMQLAEKAGIPMAVSLMAKSVIPETHPLCLGVYAGALGEERVRLLVESSDCLIMLGVLLTDFNLGVYTAHLDQSKTIHATSERIAIAHHYYEEVTISGFLSGLLSADVSPRSAVWVKPEPAPASSVPAPGAQKITVKRLFEQINDFLDQSTVLVADVGDSLFGAIDLVTCRAAQFLSPAYYTSLGFAVPASIAAQLSDPSLRPLAIVGDGAFQMTGMELSTAVRYNLSPIVVVLNNGGYATERPMLDGAFNDILPWHYHRLPEVLGSGVGFVIETEEQLADALAAARENTEAFSILDVRLAPDDISPPLRRLTAVLSKKT
jgi:indolepyruvate decarboxylase